MDSKSIYNKKHRRALYIDKGINKRENIILVNPIQLIYNNIQVPHIYILYYTVLYIRSTL